MGGVHFDNYKWQFNIGKKYVSRIIWLPTTALQ